jgi:hypothetical protein
MVLTVVLVLVASAVGFVLGYAVRGVISRHRKVRRRSEPVLDHGRAVSLVPPKGTSATRQFHHEQQPDAPVVPDQSPVP